MTPILIKTILTMIVVSGLAAIAERAGPRLAGILSGFPVGTAITLTFIGVEQGPAFAAQSALHNLAGMPAMLLMLWVYALVSRRDSRLGPAGAPLLSTVVFLLGAAGLRWLNLPAILALLLSAACVLAAGWLFRGFPDRPIDQRIRLGRGAVLFRAAVAAGVVLVVTGAAGKVGPAWAGLFTSFPVTVFPLLIILQHSYGPNPGQAVIKHIPSGLWSLIAFTLCLSVLDASMGVAWATVLALCAALGIMLVSMRAGRLALAH